ncbi:MAG TPA: hypothetical protein VF395_06945, partial [Polyangiaceae bacterium]
MAPASEAPPPSSPSGNTAAAVIPKAAPGDVGATPAPAGTSPHERPTAPSRDVPQGAAVVLPSVTPAADCTACPAIHRPDPERERELSLLAKELDSVIVDAAQDLGLTVDVSARPREATSPPSESALIERAEGGWVFSPRLAFEGNRIVVRVVAVAPGSRVVLVRSETLARGDLEVRAVLMMRDLVHAAGRAEGPAPIRAPRADEHAVVHAAR